jgi:hypothetical protein
LKVIIIITDKLWTETKVNDVPCSGDLLKLEKKEALKYSPRFFGKGKFLLPRAIGNTKQRSISVDYQAAGQL